MIAHKHVSAYTVGQIAQCAITENRYDSFFFFLTAFVHILNFLLCHLLYHIDILICLGLVTYITYIQHVVTVTRA